MFLFYFSSFFFDGGKKQKKKSEEEEVEAQFVETTSHIKIDGGCFYESAQKKKSSHNQRAHPRPKASLKKDDD